MSKRPDIAHAVASAWLWFRRQPRLRQAGFVLLIVALLGMVARYSRPAVEPGATFAVRRGSLEINVLEGGSIQALESQEIKCEVRVGHQGTKILKIIEEGYLVTEEDVKNGKVLVELDSSDLEKQLLQQEIQYQSALANFTEAQQNYQIQLNQNYSDIKAAEQKVRFARMDFDKLLGADVAEAVLAELGIEKLLAEAATNLVSTIQRGRALLSAPGNGATASDAQPTAPPTNAVALAPPANTNAPAATGTSLAGARAIPRTAPAGNGRPPRSPGGNNNSEPSAPTVGPTPEEAALEVELATEPSLQLPPPSAVDFSRFARLDALGDGEAKQKLRKFDDDLQVAQKELEQATATLEGTRRLFAKGFVTRTDLQRDEIAHENSRLKVQTAQTARALYLKYDFARTAEETLSKYLDAVRELDKTRRLAISKLAQAEARLRSAQGQYQVQLRQRNDLREQLTKCVIRAERPGLVVYGGGRDDSFFRGEEPIREGATVRERQTIITIPDMTRMAVSVRIHEAYINKVRKGQKARITVDAFPDKVLSGEVSKVALLPDSANRWMNPDLKVYVTTIAIDGSHEWLKPGMSAKVEILVNRLENVLYVPVQAVVPAERGHVCYVLKGRKPEPRPVEIGEFNDEFIEIKSGLKEGELVLLRPPPAAARPAETRPESQPPEGRPNGNAARRAARDDGVTAGVAQAGSLLCRGLAVREVGTARRAVRLGARTVRTDARAGRPYPAFAAAMVTQRYGRLPICATGQGAPVAFAVAQADSLLCRGLAVREVGTARRAVRLGAPTVGSDARAGRPYPAFAAAMVTQRYGRLPICATAPAGAAASVAETSCLLVGELPVAQTSSLPSRGFPTRNALSSRLEVGEPAGWRPAFRPALVRWALPLPAGEGWGEGEGIVENSATRCVRRSTLTLSLSLEGEETVRAALPGRGSVFRWGAAAPVAQAGSLLCRGLAVRESAPTTSRRYGRLPICATAPKGAALPLATTPDAVSV